MIVGKRDVIILHDPGGIAIIGPLSRHSVSPPASVLKRPQHFRLSLVTDQRANHPRWGLS